MPSPSPASILVVDDELRNIQVAGGVLLKDGYDIVPARSAEEALEKLRAYTPDLILLDIMMPGMSGLELCQQLNCRPSHQAIPKIFLTAAGSLETLEEAFALGAVDYLTKPFKGAELLSRVRIHLRLAHIQAETEALNLRQRHLLDTLSHDLRTPLSAISLSAELLKERATPNGDALTAQLAETISSSTTESLTLLDEITSFKLNNEEEADLILAPISLSDLAADMQARFFPVARKKSISLKIETPENTTLLADPLALTRVCGNLLSNALKFSPTGSKVSFLAEESAGKVTLHISDSGPGFTEADQKKMFRRFSRLSAQPTAGEASTGLGLYISKDLVEKMNGSLAFQTSPQGTTFHLTFPLAP